MLKISDKLAIPDQEIDMVAIRAQGAGGQNVNKVSSAIHLRFDIKSSSLPDSCKEQLLNLKDRRITNDGIIVIKAQQFRTQEKNRDAALERLRQMILRVSQVRRKRWPTKPSRGSKRQRLDAKTRRGKIKTMRKKPRDSD